MATVRMIDIAVNFTDSMFKGIYNGKQYHVGDIQAVLKRAWSAGVERIIVTGGSLEESKEALAIAETDARLFCTVGVHPTRCKEFEDSGDPEKHLQDLLTLAKEGKEKGKARSVLLYIRFVAGVANSFTGSAEDCDKLLSYSIVFIGEMLVERMMIERDSPLCDIKNTHAGIRIFFPHDLDSAAEALLASGKQLFRMELCWF